MAFTETMQNKPDAPFLEKCVMELYNFDKLVMSLRYIVGT